MPDDDRRAQHGDRHAAEAEQLLDLAPGSQVGGQVVVEVAEAAQVDDLPHPGVGRRLAELGRRLGVALLEVVGIQRVHQVVGGVHALQRGAQAVGVADVAVDRLAAAVVGVGVTGHRPHLMALLEQGGDQPGADKAGRAGDEHGGSHAVPTVPRGRSDACGRACATSQPDSSRRG